MHTPVSGKRLVHAAAVVAVVSAFGASLASAGKGATVLKAQLPSNEMFLVNGVSTFFTFTCKERRIQKPDGSALDIAHCRLNPSQTPPKRAAHEDPKSGYESDFSIAHVPGFAGNRFASSWHGVVTPSGKVTMVATFSRR